VATAAVAPHAPVMAVPRLGDAPPLERRVATHRWHARKGVRGCVGSLTHKNRPDTKRKTINVTGSLAAPPPRRRVPRRRVDQRKASSAGARQHGHYPRRQRRSRRQ